MTSTETPLTQEAAAECASVSALQQLWARRNSLLLSNPHRKLQTEDEDDLLSGLDLLPAQNEVVLKSPTPMVGIPCEESADFGKHEDGQPPPGPRSPTILKSPGRVLLDAAVLGEIPVRYIVASLRSHEMAAVGAYIDPRVQPGFRYRVRTLGEHSRPLFKGRALTLLSIGRGYGRRLTFQADAGQLNDNSNYFWSDSTPEGFALELDVVSAGDKFTVLDANHVVAGTVELLHTQGAQMELDVSHAGRGGGTEKSVRVRALCHVEWFESGEEQVLPMSGVAMVGSSLQTPGKQSFTGARLIHVALGAHLRGFTLTPGTNDQLRRTTLHGDRIGDVPTAYTIIGMEPHEMPVVGTYVDPRICTGFHYRVRRLGGVPGRWLFNSRALCLLSLGAGYGKRLTFQPDRLNSPENFFWSDSGHGDGFACEIRAVFAGQRFSVVAGGERLGEAVVFRADSAQAEESSESVDGGGILKRVRVDVTCHVSLDTAATQAMRVSGTALVLREPKQARAKLLRLENVGLNSQLNLLFVRQSASVVFYPL